MTHPVLSSLSSDDQYAEIAGSRRRLEAILGSPVLTFSYPHNDFSDETVEIVRAVGFRAAVNGRVESGDDLFRLQRFAVFNWDMATLRRRLETFFMDVNGRH